jgi:hypothetical protein
MLNSYLDSLEKSSLEEQRVLLPTKTGNGSIKSGWAKKLAAGAVAAIALVALAARLSIEDTKSFQFHTPNLPLLSLETVASSSSPFSISTFNEYGDPRARRAASGAQDYPFLIGSFLLEPYKSNTVSLSASTASAGEVAWKLSQDDSVL